MAQKRLGQIDMNTGEVLQDGFVAYIAPKRQNGFGTRWLAMAQNAIQALAKQHRELGTEGFAVLLSMISRVEYENAYQAVSQAEIAEELEMQPSNVSRSVKRLVQMGVFLIGPRIGRSNTYRLNPEFGWKGSAKNHVVALDQLRKDRMKAAKISGVVQGGKGASSQDEQQPRAAEVSQEDTQTGDLFTA